ncbi:hypothetical protein OOK41_31195 [Micromonospora sp. NBC_01655]|uniref:hypothetical protein n=1 Tax=Micromonospora sp. NBC_01655 TaxID=2975983 RepID=UPI0022570775|nr:hypothetical protein [Micromonospora sp. NBC_01655]MCX4474727.1 hypothetical protein [Micromonospora sp. NBC_01655]
MSVDHEMAAEDDPVPGIAVTVVTVVGYGLAAVVLVAWFLYGWLVQRQGFVASVGESAGAGFALLLAVSVVGTVRRSRR